MARKKEKENPVGCAAYLSTFILGLFNFGTHGDKIKKQTKKKIFKIQMARKTGNKRKENPVGCTGEGKI